MKNIFLENSCYVCVIQKTPFGIGLISTFLQFHSHTATVSVVLYETLQNESEDQHFNPI